MKQFTDGNALSGLSLGGIRNLLVGSVRLRLMTWFKFIPYERFKSLRGGLVRFTQPGAFNDPFEMPAFKAAEAEAMRLAGLAGLTAQTSEIMQGLSAGRIPQAAFRLPITYWLGSARAEPPPDPVPSEEAIERVRRIDDTFGILSLCTTADNLLLWAHYAAEHRGLAVEVDIDDPALRGPTRGDVHFQLARPVKYSAERPLIPESEEILFEHFFVKSVEWAYEQEFRIVRKLQLSTRTIAAKPHPIHLFPLPPSSIRRVVFGARVPEAARRHLMMDTRLDERFAHVGFAEAVLDPRRYWVKIHEVEVPTPAARRSRARRKASPARDDDTSCNRSHLTCSS